MPNLGVKARLNQPVKAGRPAGVYKFGVPAQERYKQLRQLASQGRIQIDQQRIQQLRQQSQNQNSMGAFERRVTFSSDINDDPVFRI